MNFAASTRYAIAVLFFFIWVSACVPISPPEPPPPPAESLLRLTPYVADEAELRENPPEPVRVIINNSSVAAWKLPREAMLRFPVELRESARLTFRLGAQTRVPIRIGDLTIRVEYMPVVLPPKPDQNGESVENDETTVLEPVVLFQTTPVESPQCFTEWLHVDVSLETFAPGRGEIKLSSEGPLSDDPGLDILFGQPAIYHPAEMRDKNILLIGVDTLRQDSLTPYGASELITPNLQDLSETATLFTQARSQAPWTLPSFASIITGRLPSSIGATIYTGHLPERATTIGEFLLPQGYATATFCSNTWLGNDQSGFQQGIEELWFQYDARADVSVDRAMDFIERSKDRDWFCFLHFIDPHAPYRPPEEFVDLLTDPAYNGPYRESFGQIEVWKSGEVMPPEEDIRHIRNLYDGEVAHVDQALGDLFAFLEENGQMENTLMIFASDHGEEFFEHDGFEHGHTQFDELVLMPLLLQGAGFPPGVRVDAPVGNTDIVPTILEFLDIEIPDNLTGRPLQHFLPGSVEDDRLIFGEDNSRGTMRKFCVEWPNKCILDFVTGENRLYDLSTDPGETEDISEANPELTARLAREIIAAMIPDQTAFHIWITRSYGESSKVFSGSLHIPGGIDQVHSFKLSENDTYAIQGDTVTFTIASSFETLGPNKHLLIIPAEGSDALEATVLVDGRVQNERFFPYGSRTPEPSGNAIVRIDDFPLGPNLPLAIEEYPAGCYVWAVRGYDREENRPELDERTREQLRSLGYATW